MTPRWCAACSRGRGSRRVRTGAVWDTTADEPRDTTLTVLSGELEGWIRRSGLLASAGENEPDDETLPRPLGRLTCCGCWAWGCLARSIWRGTISGPRGRHQDSAPRRDRVADDRGGVPGPRPSTPRSYGTRRSSRSSTWSRSEDGTVFVVMEYIEGSTLRQMLKNGPLAPGWAAGLIIQVADALH